MNGLTPIPAELISLELSEDAFVEKALEVFGFQYARNPTYRAFTDAIGIRPEQVDALEKIPFLPIQFFKKYRILSNDGSFDTVFRSSTTTGGVPSEHYIASLGVYDRSLSEGFRLFYGDPKEYCIIGLLPSYLERGDSSLVYMVQSWIEQSENRDSGFYLYDYPGLVQKLVRLNDSRQKTLLVGVTYALVDLAEQYDLHLGSTILLETGGMKGRRRELIREELHELLMKKLRPLRIDSEYGMTELLSQSYKIGDKPFRPVPWKRVFGRAINDPMGPFSDKTGKLHVIDLANVYSCAFIATEDIGKVYLDGTFDVLGRYDHAEARGCNLMLSL
ncbi:MAG: acyl transferase [Thermaurantimonas sp.]